MDVREFRRFANATIDYIVDYLENIRDKPVLPPVDPGYLQPLIPDHVPEIGEKWEDVLKDMDRVIMPGVTHWHSPQFHAYYPTANSYPGIVGEMLCAGIGSLGYSWETSPVVTELEVAVMDWLGKALGLPQEFLNSAEGPGGGIIQGSASESTLVGMLAAKERMLRKVQTEHPEWDVGTIKGKLVAYTSEHSNSSVEKTGLLGSMPMRLLPCDSKCRLRGATLEKAFQEDRQKGLIPCYVVATLGTTGTCAFDCMKELGPICNRDDVWLHVDAAYAGAAFVCPEYRHHMAGIHMADSFNFNPHKWLLVNSDCSAMWVKDSSYLVDAFNVDPNYLQHHQQGVMPDYRHWQIPLGRRFRSLKLWLVLRIYGVQGLQDHIRKQIGLAQEFEQMARNDPRFDIVTEVSMGVVCFRLRGPNILTKRLLSRLTTRRRIYLVSATVREDLLLRFVVCSRWTEKSDITFAWNEIRNQASIVLSTTNDDDLKVLTPSGRLPNRKPISQSNENCYREQSKISSVSSNTRIRDHDKKNTNRHLVLHGDRSHYRTKIHGNPRWLANILTRGCLNYRQTKRGVGFRRTVRSFSVSGGSETRVPRSRGDKCIRDAGDCQSEDDGMETRLICVDIEYYCGKQDENNNSGFRSLQREPPRKSSTMDATEFRKFGKAAVDYLADYIENIREKSVLPSITPGYLQPLIPDHVPETGEKWEDVLKDMDRVIMPGVTHWHSPQFHAYYPTANSYPGIVGEMLSAGIGCVGFSWITSPACTELEVAMMDWLGKLMDLPKEFLNCSEGPGGGVIQGSASEATLVGLLAAKERMLRKIQAEHPEWDVGTIKGKLVAYASDQSNSSVEKAGLLGSMPMRLLPCDSKCRLRGTTLEKAFQEDRQKGLIPCYVVATLGTTGTCAFDCMEELGPICNRDDVWLHVDAAYAGAAFICPEYRHHMAGIHMADSFNFNPHKWMLVNFDCSAMWVKDSSYLVDAFNVDRIYLKHHQQGVMPDYRHWQIPLGRRFRSLKLWLVLRIYGVQGLQDHIRKQIGLAQEFEQMVRNDPRFDIVTEVSMGVACFRIKGPNTLTKRLLDRLTARRRIYLVSAKVQDELVIRFVICSRLTESRDVVFAWDEIESQSHIVLTTPNDDDLLLPVEAANGEVNGHNGQVNGHNGHVNGHSGHVNDHNAQVNDQNGQVNGHNGKVNCHNGQVNGHNGHTNGQLNGKFNGQSNGNANGHSNEEAHGNVNGNSKTNGSNGDFNGIVTVTSHVVEYEDCNSCLNGKIEVDLETLPAKQIKICQNRTANEKLVPSGNLK